VDKALKRVRWQYPEDSWLVFDWGREIAALGNLQQQLRVEQEVVMAP